MTRNRFIFDSLADVPDQNQKPHAQQHGTLPTVFEHDVFHNGTLQTTKIDYFSMIISLFHIFVAHGTPFVVSYLNQTAPDMFRHFLHTTFSNLRRNPVYGFINIAGLAVGLAASMLILLHVANEYSYDRFHKNGDRLYRVLFSYSDAMGSGYSNTITAAVGPTLMAEIPGIESFVRFTAPREGFLAYHDSIYTTQGIVFADSSFFDCFSFDILTGDRKQQLREPYTMVITKSLAEKCFAGENPIGKSMKISGKYNALITGVAADPPENSHIKFQAVISFGTLYLDKTLYMGWDGGNQYNTWIQLAPEFNWNHANQLLPSLLNRHINDRLKNTGIELKLAFEPMRDVYLYSKTGAEGNPFMLRILTAIALFILLLASFNYANLSTARAMRRFRETGIRKVSGATSSGLLRFYWAEALLTALIAWFIALMLIELAQPWFNGIVGHELGLWKRNVWWFVPSSLIIVAITAFISGLYPALFLARMQPADVLKGGYKPGRQRFTFSNILIVLQFALSSALMTSTLIVDQQLDYGMRMNRGYNIDNVLAIELSGAQSKKDFASAKAALKQLTGVMSVTSISEIPVNGVTQNGYRIQDFAQVEIINSIETDGDFFDVMQIPVIAGVDFEHSSERNGVMVNQKFAEEMGWMDSEGNPLADAEGLKNGGVGKVMVRDTVHKIIGIVANFNHGTLYDPMRPLVIARKPYTGYNHLLIRTDPDKMRQVDNAIEQTWSSLFPDEPFVSYPVISSVEQGFRTEKSLGVLLNSFAFLALLIATLGLVGLASFQTRQRQRSIGLRRILGASPASLVINDSIRFLKLVLLAHLLTLPVVYWSMESWLNTFAFHISFPWLITIPVALLLIIMGGMAVITQVIKTVRANPIEAIRYE